MGAGEGTLPSRARGAAALALAGLLFGSTFLVVGNAIEQASVAAFLAARFLIGAAVLWPLARRRAATVGEVRAGVLAGLALVGGFVTQTAGLRTVDGATSAFITYLLVVIVPLLGVVRWRRAPESNVIAGVVLAVAGIWGLSGGISGVGRGEVLTLVCAVFFALHIVILGEVAADHDPLRLTMWSVLTVGLVCLGPGAASADGYGFPAEVWAAAAFTGVGATAGAFWCMAWGQRVVPDAQAAIIYLLEPVSAGVLGALTGDPLGAGGVVGAAVILAAVLVAELGGRRPTPPLGPELSLVTELDADLGLVPPDQAEG